jgi:hypothetical protein
MLGSSPGLLRLRHWEVKTLSLLSYITSSTRPILSSTRPILILNSYKSHPQQGQISSSTLPNLILNSTKSHPQLCQISSSTLPNLILNSAQSHPQLDQISSSTLPNPILNSAKSILILQWLLLGLNRNYRAVLRIHDILVWIRIHGSMPLTNGSGFGSGSSYFRH